MAVTLHDRLSAAAGTARQQVVTRLERRGYSPRRLEDVQRSVLWWTWARAQALRNVRPMVLRGNGLAWGPSGFVEMVPAEVPVPGRGQVTVLVEASVVSPGTERAQYLHLPNTATGVLGRPGYSCAGEVVATGAGVHGLRVGDAVAATGAAHASIVTVDQKAVFPVPFGVSVISAALIQLGIICEQGLRRADLHAGTPFCVLGAGPIGALSLRLALASGAGPGDVVARSLSKEESALAGGARRFIVAPRDGAVAAAGTYPVVIESTGDPEALLTAVALAAPGGRVVLLGSPRGVTSRLPVDEIRSKELLLVGAHVDTLDSEVSDGHGQLRRQCGEVFLREIVIRPGSYRRSRGSGIRPTGSGTLLPNLGQGRLHCRRGFRLDPIAILRSHTPRTYPRSP